MAKKLGKLIIFGAAIGATAAGVYHYLQSKDNVSDEFDDFDDFDNLDDIEEDAVSEDSKKYVALDSAKAFVAGTLDKAKDVISKASKKLKNESETEFVDITTDDTADKADEAKEAADDSGKSTEDFFDDDEA